MKKFGTAVLVLGALLTGAPHASAHAILASSFPTSKSVISLSPTKVWLDFDGDLVDFPGKSVNHIYLTDSKGRTIPILRSYVGGSRITAELKKISSTGKITMSWRVVSEDGHPVTGSIFFYLIPKKI
jgi:methionine-rich copper-binding protein CopC